MNKISLTGVGISAAIQAIENHFNEQIENVKKRQAQPTPVCPKCGNDDVDRGHHEFDITVAGDVPDCSFWSCVECGERWDFQ